MKQYIFVLSLLALQFLHAELQKVQSAPSDKNSSVSFDANLRAGYIHFKDSVSGSTSAKATIARIGLNKKFSDALSTKFAFYTQESFGSDNTNNDFTIKNGDTTSSFGFLGEATLNADFDKHHFTLGRQKMDLTHNDSDDIRLLPDLFEAYSYNYNETIFFDHILAMAGWENGGNHTLFLNVHDVLGITDASSKTINKGISVIHTEGKSADETFEYALYDYIIHDALNIVYAEASYNTSISKDTKLTLAAQYDIQTSTNTFTMGSTYTSFDSTVLGLKTSFELSPLNLIVTLAGNQVSGTNAPLGSLGGGVLFTSLEYFTLDAVGTNDATAYITSLEYDAGTLLAGLSLTYYYGAFASGDKSVDAIEQNFGFEYAKEDQYTLTFAYASVDNVTGTSDYDQVRMFIDIAYE